MNRKSKPLISYKFKKRKKISVRNVKKNRKKIARIRIKEKRASTPSGRRSRSRILNPPESPFRSSPRYRKRYNTTLEISTPTKRLYRFKKFSAEGKHFLKFLTLKEEIREFQRKIESSSKNNLILVNTLNTKTNHYNRITNDLRHLLSSIRKFEKVHVFKYRNELNKQLDLNKQLKELLPKKKRKLKIGVSDFVDILFQKENELKVVDTRIFQLESKAKNLKVVSRKRGKYWDNLIKQKKAQDFKKRCSGYVESSERVLTTQLKQLSDEFDTLTEFSRNQTRDIDDFTKRSKELNEIEIKKKLIVEQCRKLDTHILNLQYEVNVAKKIINFKQNEIFKIDYGFLKNAEKKQICTLETEKVRLLKNIDTVERKIKENNKTLVWQKHEVDKYLQQIAFISETIENVYDHLQCTKIRPDMIQSDIDISIPTLEKLESILSKASIEPKSRTIVSLKDFKKISRICTDLRKKSNALEKELCVMDEDIEYLDQNAFIIEKSLKKKKGRKNKEEDILVLEHEYIKDVINDKKRKFLMKAEEYSQEIMELKKK